MVNAEIVDEDIHNRHRGGDGVAAFGRSEIARNGLYRCAWPPGAKLVVRLRDTVRCTPVQDHPGPHVRQPAERGVANAPGRSGDQRNAAGEIKIHGC